MSQTNQTNIVITFPNLEIMCVVCISMYLCYYGYRQYDQYQKKKQIIKNLNNFYMVMAGVYGAAYSGCLVSALNTYSNQSCLDIKLNKFSDCLNVFVNGIDKVHQLTNNLIKVIDKSKDDLSKDKIKKNTNKNPHISEINGKKNDRNDTIYIDRGVDNGNNFNIIS